MSASADAPGPPDDIRSIQQSFGRYRIISRAYFYLPLLIIAFDAHGASILGLAVLTSAYGLAVTVTAPLFGARLAQLSARQRLVRGEMLRGASLAVVAIGLMLNPGTASWALIALGQAASGLGFGFGAGQDSRLMRARMEAAGATSKVSEVEGRTQSLAFVTVLVSGFIGVGLIEIWNAGPFVAGAITAILSSQLAGRFGTRETPTAPAAAYSRSVGTIPASRGDNAVLWFYATVRGLALALFVFLVPIALVVGKNPSTAALVGVLACFSLAAFATGRRAGTIKAWATRTPSGPLALGAGATVIAIISLAIAAETGSDLRWVAAAASATLGGICSALVRPLCFGALSAEATANGATERAERLCSAINLGAVLVSGALLWSVNDGAWIAVTAAGSLFVVAATAWALAGWPRQSSPIEPSIAGA